MPSYNGYFFTPIDKIIKFSIDNESTIRDEHAKLVDFYIKNPTVFLMDMMNNANIDRVDYLSNKIAEAASNMIGNIGLYNFGFDENNLLNSYGKINSQIRKVPLEELMNNDEAKIIFYDLLPEPSMRCSRLTLGCLKIDWKNFEFDYYARSN